MAMFSGDRRWIWLVTGGIAAILLLLLIRPGEPKSEEIDPKLARIGDLEQNKDIEGLSAAAKDSNATVAVAAIAALGRVGDRQSRAAIEGSLDASRPVEVRKAAAGALGNRNISTRDEVEGLNKAMKDKAPEVRAAAAQSLGNLVAFNGMDALIAALDDPDQYVRDCSIKAIQGIIGILPPFQATDPRPKRMQVQADLKARLPVLRQRYDAYVKRLEQEKNK